MSKAKQKLKAQKREAFWAKRNIDKSGKTKTNCPRCGNPGPHFVPPSFNEIGFFSCDPPADITNYTRVNIRDR